MSPPTEGGRADPARPCVLVVGHASGMHLFGGERSLLQLLDLFDDIGHDVVVALPPSENAEYAAAVLARCRAVHTTPVPPRAPHLPADETVVATFCAVIARHQVVAVHSNTIVPREALLAARRCGVPAVVHAREIPGNDPELAQWLRATPDELVASVLAEADYVVANSLATALTYPLPGRVAIVPNFVDVAEFARPPELAEPADVGRPRVALIGSTTEKKGVREFVELAVLLAPFTDAHFVVVGPESPLTHQLRAEGLPANMQLAGYAPTPVAAMAQADIVLNMSRCDESFGRALLEAMAAGLPVVAYARGALAELVTDGETGWLVPPDDLTLLAHRVLHLCRDPQLRQRMGANGRVAAERFSRQAAGAALRTAYRAIVPSERARRQAAGDIVVHLPSANRSRHRHPFFVGTRARFAHASATVWLDEQHLLVASLLGRRTYTVRVDQLAGSAAVIAEAATTDGVHEVSVDLVDFDGIDRVVTADCEAGTVSVHRVGADLGLQWTSSVGPAAAGRAGEASDAGAARPVGYCHGATFVPGHPDLVCASFTSHFAGVHFLSLEERRSVHTIDDPLWSPKEVAFAGERLMVVAAMDRLIEPHPHARHRTKLSLYALAPDARSHTLLYEIVLDATAADGCVFHGDRLYLADQLNDAVLVFHLRDGQLLRLPDLVGFSFPHDVAVSPDGTWLAVACYGDNTLHLRRVVTRPPGG